MFDIYIPKVYNYNKIKFIVIWNDKYMKTKLKGSSLMWAVCLMALSVIIISGVLASAQIFHSRTVAQTNKQQAVYTAMSAVSLISDDIQNDSHYDKWLEMLWDNNMNMPHDKIHTIENVKFSNDDMGDITLVFEWITDKADKFPYTMKLTAEAVCGDESESISALFEFDSDKKWSFLKYGDDFYYETERNDTP